MLSAYSSKFLCEKIVKKEGEIKNICTLERQIAKIKQEITCIEDLGRGLLSEQYNVYRTSGCKYKTTPPKSGAPIIN